MVSLRRRDGERRVVGSITSLGPGWLTVLSLAAFLAVVSLACLRVAHHENLPGETIPGRWALVDFRDAVYYPVVSFTSGDNPYQVSEFLARYPVANPYPPLTPLFLLTHAGFALLAHTTAQTLYFALTIVLTLFLAFLVLAMCGHRPTAASVLALAALILASRPGYWNLMLGQITLEFVVAVYLALHFGRRSPWVSALALAWATMKPTFGLPLALLMVANRFYRAVGIGVAVTALATLVPTAILVHSAGGVAPFMTSVLGNLTAVVQSPSANPVLSSSRIDAYALLSRLLGSAPGGVAEVGVFALIIAIAWMTTRRIHRLPEGRDRDLYCTALASLAILCASYQLLYGALLLTLPMAALAVDRWPPRGLEPPSLARPALVLLMAVPLLNYLIAARVLALFHRGTLAWLALVSMNGVAVLLALGVYTFVAYSSPLGIASAGPQGAGSDG